MVNGDLPNDELAWFTPELFATEAKRLLRSNPRAQPADADELVSRSALIFLDRYRDIAVRNPVAMFRAILRNVIRWRRAPKEIVGSGELDTVVDPRGQRFVENYLDWEVVDEVLQGLSEETRGRIQLLISVDKDYALAAKLLTPDGTREEREALVVRLRRTFCDFCKRVRKLLPDDT